jgi:hypothetical protein
MQAPSSACATLQQALAGIGEELERQEKSAAASFRQLQQKLATLSQQMEQAEAQMTARMATLERARRAAQAEAEEAKAAAEAMSTAASTSSAPPGTSAAADAEDDERAVDRGDDGSAIEPPSKVFEAPVARTPPPAGSAGSPPAAHPAPTAMPVAARPIPQAIAAPRAASPAAERGVWERIVLGPALAQHPSLAADRAELIDGMLAGDDAAVGLVGQLMIFNSAAAERMPQLLKDVGEAWYAWRPHAGGDAMRDALIDYLGERCQSAGVGNTIELVRPGDRYDHTKHNAKQRGVEIDDVLGWIVLRDNGKVYTKASVSVK